MDKLLNLCVLGFGLVLLVIVSMVVVRFIGVVWLVLDRLANHIETKIKRDIFKNMR